MQKPTFNRKDKAALRKQLRNNATSAEAFLWRARQKRQVKGRKFRRQHGIGPYVVDFYCPAEKLVVELDGSPHFDLANGEKEDARARYMESLGIKVIRVENKQVFEHLDNVLYVIEMAFGGDL